MCKERMRVQVGVYTARESGTAMSRIAKQVANESSQRQPMSNYSIWTIVFKLPKESIEPEGASRATPQEIG